MSDPVQAVVPIVREFYANAKAIGESGHSWVRGHKIHFKLEDINQFLGFPPSAIDDILKQPILLDDSDNRPCWMGNSNGGFFLSSAWAIVHTPHQLLHSAKFIWHKFLPGKISIFMWRLFLFKLPLDEGLWKKGFQLAYGCLCVQHELLVWTTCQSMFGLPILGSTIHECCSAGWFDSSSIVHALLPLLILWHLWKSRNQAVLDSTMRSAPSILTDVQSELHSILLALGYFVPVSSMGVASFNKRKQANIRAVQWFKPGAGVVKLNLNGACHGNPSLSGGGGVNRDDKGDFIYAYASFFGVSTNTLSELRALYQGVLWLYSNGFHGVSIEMDSQLLFNCLTKGHKPPWKCSYFIWAIRAMQLERNFSFLHCFREANTAADGLAKFALDTGMDSTCSFFSALPRHIRGIIILDVDGTPRNRIS